MVWTAPQADIEAHLRRRPELHAALEAIGNEVAGEYRGIAFREAYDTGELVSSVHVVRMPDGTVRVRAEAKQAAPNEGGTGVYGPRRAPIVAKPGRPFVFRTRLPPASSPARIQASVLGGTVRKLVLTEHRGMPGHDIMGRAGALVAGQSSGLRWRPSPWKLAP